MQNMTEMAKETLTARDMAKSKKGKAARGIGEVDIAVREGAHLIGKVVLSVSPSAESMGAAAPTLVRKDDMGRMDSRSRCEGPRRTTTIQIPVPGH